MQHSPSVASAATVAVNLEAMQHTIGNDCAMIGRFDASVQHRVKQPGHRITGNHRSALPL